MKLLIILTAFLVFGCSNAEYAAINSWSKPHDVKCYSGGVLVYSGVSTGKIISEHESDGFYFEEAGTQKIVIVNADCVFTIK